MEHLVKRVIVIMLAVTFLAGRQADAGNPIGDFFKRLGDSIAHPQSSPAPQRTLKTGASGKKPRDNEQTAPQEMPPVAGPSVAPTPTPTPMPRPRRTAMPVPMVVRSAVGVPPSKRPRRDLPYGIPVPNKAGFVTSPYAPKSGYVDVRGFSSSTEVRDPYTGKIFLAP